MKPRKRLEQKIEQFSSVFAQLPDPVIITDSEFNIVSVNKPFEDISGYILEDIAGKKIGLLNTEPQAETIQPDFYDAIAKEDIWRSNALNAKKDGSTWNCEATISALVDKQGQPFAYVAILRDITEKEDAKHETKERIKELNGLLNLGKLVDESDDLDTILNKFVQDVVPNSMQYPDKVIVNLAINEKDYNNNNNNKVESLASPIKVKGEERGLLTIGYSEKKGFIKKFEQNLTSGYAKRLGKVIERLETEEKLKESERNYRTILESMTDAVYICSPDFRVEYMNPAMIKQIGRDCIGKVCHKIIHNQNKECSFCVQNRVQEGKTLETEILSPKNNRYYLVSHCPITHQDGSISKMTIYKDITEKRKAEKVVIQSERLSAIGELASGVAHDFNNSLQGIFGNVELALLEDSSSEVRGYLETIKKSASDAASRIKQLQRFAGKRNESPEYQVIDFNSIADDAIKQTRTLWKDEAQKDGLDIAVNTHYGDDVSVLGNQGDLRSTLYNLIKNSVQAMPDGGTIDIATKREDEKAYLTLADTGEGMDEDTKARIFQPFFTTKGFEQGTGLGMTGAYSIINEHKGEIYVKKTGLGKGTTFEIVLPYAQRKTISEKDKPQEYEGIARVLWVDDEEMIRDLGKRQVERIGHKGDVASSGQEALELLANNEYDLMITDIGMPGMSGWQLAEQIKGKYSGMKVAVITGWGADVEPKQKEQYGIGYVLGKPVGMDKIKDLIGEVLQMKTK